MVWCSVKKSTGTTLLLPLPLYIFTAWYLFKHGVALSFLHFKLHQLIQREQICISGMLLDEVGIDLLALEQR
jgi:hypothetical protein